VKRIADARFSLIAETSDTHGHPTDSRAVTLKPHLADLLARTED
jgi:hypothetical protein